MILIRLLPLLLAATSTSTVATVAVAVGEEDPAKVVVTFTLYDNGSSEGGVDVTMSEADFPVSPEEEEQTPPGEAFAVEMSRHVEVSKYMAEEPVVATSAYREDGELITTFGQLEPAEGSDGEKRRVYLVADGLYFVWPFVEVGHRQAVSPNVLPPVTPDVGSPVIVESLSERPRVFRVLNMFSLAEATGIMDNALNLTGVSRLKRSTVGSGKDEDGEDIAREDVGRTSHNAWDHESDGAKAMITRSFQLTNIEENAGKRDGLQVVRYFPGQGYNTHPDYFTPKDDVDYDFHPYSGGSNRFATVFMYLNDVEEGGNTVFPRAPGIVPETEPPQYALDMFDENTWERTVTKQCFSKLAVPPEAGTAALFYSITPDGQIDPSSHHGACPVIKGTKWGANIWIWNKQRYGEIRTGDPRHLSIRNVADEPVYISWEGRENGVIKPGKIMPMNTFEYHRFKASMGNHKEKAIAEFTVQSEPEDGQVWEIKQPRQQRRQVQASSAAQRGGADKRDDQRKVLITNQADENVHISWRGKEFGVAEPGGGLTMHSFEGHTIDAAVASNVDEPYAQFVVGREEYQTWTIEGPTTPGSSSGGDRKSELADEL